MEQSVNTATTIACAKGVYSDRNLLECNGEHIHLAKYLMECMGFVKSRASTKAKVSLLDFER